MNLDLANNEIDETRSVTLDGKVIPAINQQFFKTTVEVPSGDTALLTSPGSGGLVVLMTPQILHGKPPLAPDAKSVR